MFGKSLQNILRAYALKSLTKEDELFALSVLNKMPLNTFKENWPYGQL
jgi:hypothetical protein